MIMRYQRISPESEPVSNGRRTNSPSNPNWKISKEDEDKAETAYSNWYMKTNSSTLEGKGISSRFRSPSRTSHQEHQNGCNGESPNSPPTTATSASTASNSATNQLNHEVVGNGGETFLQWGHRKRSRCSRGIITMADDTSSSSTSGAQLHAPPPPPPPAAAKIQRKLSPNNANLMPPPSIPATTSSPNGIHQTGSALKSQTRNISSNPSPLRRNQVEERSQSGGGNRSITGRSRAVKRTTPTPSSSLSVKDEKKLNYNGCSQSLQINQAAVNSDRNHILSPPQQGGCSSSAVINDDNNSGRGGGSGKLLAGAAAAGGGGEVIQWPRIYIPLSKKEKEEDFLAIKGTKLPYRPKKRPKAIDKIIQYCYPGMWLPELTKSRYEVREKKSSKKQKRRGLKGMESMESDSE